LIGAELRNPDFVTLAESFGMAGFRVATPAQLKHELDKALSRKAPALIEVTVDRSSEVSPWEFLMPVSRKAG
jgi:acetolactate synthase-1/2/3 large subunit